MTAISLVQVESQAGTVACALTSSAYQDRIAQLADAAARTLVSRRPIDGGERLTFTDTPEAERELRAAIAAESACCSFLGMSLTRTRDGLVLDVTGPEAAQPIIAQLFA
ncbi:MAG TPA: hypothetical protein VFR97_01040 [Capillimicrobium sp.]|nr:hypothetical protein [Capillimicrobium sp.]